LKSRNGWSLLILSALAALIVGCPRQRTPPPTPAATPPPPQKLEPWTWHRLGGLLVVEGEVDEPVDLVLKGRYLNEHRHAEYGPVRWETYAPPPTEVAELRSSEGKLLARWDFSAPPPRKDAEIAAVSQKPAPMPAASKLAANRTPIPPVVRDIQPHLFPPVSPPKPRPSRSHHRSPTTSSAAPVPLPSDKQIPLSLVPTPSLTLGWPGSGEAFNLLRGPRKSHQICLTFDGGSSAEVALDVLDALKQRGLRTTFFLTGSFIRKYPDIVRRIAAEGHEIGNHTLDHPHFAPNYRRDPRWTKERFQMELLQADAALFQVLGRPMDPYWRAPYGEQTSELRAWAEELGYRHVGWSEGADTLDWATPQQRKIYRTGDAILDRLRERMDGRDGDGLIVLMHLGSARPVKDRPANVLGPFIDEALREGWHFVNIGTYMNASGKPHWDSTNRLALLGHPLAITHTASKR